MGERLAFDRLVHSDWSMHAHKRWTAVANRTRVGWQVRSLNQTSEFGPSFIDYLADKDRKTLAGFDFAIGLPDHYLNRIEDDFVSFLSKLKNEDVFFEVARHPDEISLGRPFFPHRSLKGYGRAPLLRGHDDCAYIDLLRACEKATKDRPKEACSIFLTCNQQQVGKAALSGWKEIIIPAVARGVHIWPFHGRISSPKCNLVIAETYPAEAYHHIGLCGFRGKTNHLSRIKACEIIRTRLDRLCVELALEVEQVIGQGFGDDKEGEDRFDALVGLVSMIAVVDGHLDESPYSNINIQQREGWIVGQTCLPLDQV